MTDQHIPTVHKTNSDAIVVVCSCGYFTAPHHVPKPKGPDGKRHRHERPALDGATAEYEQHRRAMRGRS